MTNVIESDSLGHLWNHGDDFIVHTEFAPQIKSAAQVLHDEASYYEGDQYEGKGDLEGLSDSQ